MKSKLLLILLLLLSLTLLFGCNDDNPEETDTTETTAEQVAADVAFVSGGELKFTIITPMNRTENERLQADIVANCFERYVGTRPEIKRFNDRKDTYDEATLEIVLGNVEYAVTDTVAVPNAYDAYAIQLIGNKLYIKAENDRNLPDAVSALVKVIAKVYKDGELVIEGNFLQTGSGTDKLLAPLGGVPCFDGDLAAISDCADGFTQMTYKNTEDADLTAYTQSLEAEGFTKHASNDLNGNRFFTYTKNQQTVHVYHTPHNGETRVIGGKNAILPATETVKYKKVCDETAVLLGAGEAFGLIVRLEDGSFLIFDGGNEEEKMAQEIQLYLQALAPDKKNVVIRAWVITHAHGDHYGGFKEFSETRMNPESAKYDATFHLENIIMNLCDSEEQVATMGAGSFDAVRNVISKYHANTPVYKCFTGQVFYFAGVEMEVLTCMSDLLPTVIGYEKMKDVDLSRVDGNLQSIVVRLKMQNQSLMVTGDVSKILVDEMCDRFGSYLKTDILCVPHHGHNEDRYRARNGTVEFYTLVDPETALWPASVDGQQRRMEWNGKSGGNYEANYTLVNKLHLKTLIVAGDESKVVKLTK